MGNLMTRELIRLSKSSIGNEEINAVTRVLEKEYLGMGEEVQQFENALSRFFGREAVCVVNGTAALQLALEAAGIGQGDEVLVQSLTYVASFQAITAAGATPIACEISQQTLTIDLNDAKAKLTPKVKAIMPVHYGGGVGDLSEIYSFAKENKLRVIEDAAHAFGSIYNLEKVGGIGDIACFSFDGIKNITSGEGGCIVTNDQNILRKVKDLRLLGVERDTEKRYSGLRSWEFDVKEQGWRCHMSNIMAAIGIEQLKKIEKISSIRQKIAKKYDSILGSVSGVRLLENDYSYVVPHIYVVMLEDASKRKKIREKLECIGIQTGIHYQPNHKLSYFYNETNKHLPVTDDIYSRLISLPLHLDIQEDDIEYICEELIRVLNE